MNYKNIINTLKKNNYDLNIVYNTLGKQFINEEHFYVNSFVELCGEVTQDQPKLNDFKRHYSNCEKLINESLPKVLNILNNDLLLKINQVLINPFFMSAKSNFNRYLKFISIFVNDFGLYTAELIFFISTDPNPIEVPNNIFMHLKNDKLDADSISKCISNTSIPNENDYIILNILTQNQKLKKKFSISSSSHNKEMDQNYTGLITIIQHDNLRVFKLFFDDSELFSTATTTPGNKIQLKKEIVSDPFWFLVCLFNLKNITRYLLTDYPKEKEEKGQVNPFEIDPLYLLEITSIISSNSVAEEVLDIFTAESIIKERDHLEGVSGSKFRVLDVNLLFPNEYPNTLGFLSVLNKHKISINTNFFQKYSTYNNHSIFKSLFYQRPFNNSNDNNRYSMVMDYQSFRNSFEKYTTSNIHFKNQFSKIVNIDFIFDIEVKEFIFKINFNNSPENISIFKEDLDFKCQCHQFRVLKTPCIHLYLIFKYYDIPVDSPLFLKQSSSSSSSKNQIPSFLEMFLFFKLYTSNRNNNNNIRNLFKNNQIVDSPIYFTTFNKEDYSIENKSLIKFKQYEILLNMGRLASYFDNCSTEIYYNIQQVIGSNRFYFSSEIGDALLENLKLYGKLSKDFISEEILIQLIINDNLPKLIVLFKHWEDMPVYYKNIIPLSFFAQKDFLFKGARTHPEYFKRTISNVNGIGIGDDIKDFIMNDQIFNYFLQFNHIQFSKKTIIDRLEILCSGTENNTISIISFLSALGQSYSDYNLGLLQQSWGYENYFSFLEQYPINLKNLENCRNKIEQELLLDEKINKKMNNKKNKLNNNSNNKKINNNKESNKNNINNNINGNNSNNNKESIVVKKDNQIVKNSLSPVKQEVFKKISNVSKEIEVLDLSTLKISESNSNNSIEEKKEEEEAIKLDQPPVKQDIAYDIQVGKFKFSKDQNNILGMGSNGTLVFKGLWNNRIPVAIKKMNKIFNPNISKEIEALIKLTDRVNNNNNVVRYIDQEEDSDYLYLGLTLCGKSLQDLIASNQLSQFIGTNNINERIKQLITDLANGIQFLHSNDIVHNDLNPRNILTKDGRFIISDLGLSKLEVSTSFNYSMHAPTGQEGFHPTEVLMEKRKTKSVDIFSLGCIIYYFMTNGQHPFGEKLFRVVNIISDKHNLDHLKFTQPILCDLIQQMISKNETLRPSISQIFQHPFFWNTDQKIKFIDQLNNLFKDSHLFNSNLNKLLNFIDIEINNNSNNSIGNNNNGSGSNSNISNTPYLNKPWNKIIDPVLIEHITNRQQQIIQQGGISGSKKTYIYNYDQIKDLIRCIRNTIQHHKEIQKIIQSYNNKNNNNNNKEIIESLSTHESVLNYFESKLPDLLFFLYHKFKYHNEFKKFNLLNKL